MAFFLSPLGSAPLAQPRALLGPASPAGPAPLLPGATAARLGRSAQRAAPAQPARLLRSQPLPAGPAGQLFPPPSSRATRNRSGGRAATAPAPRASWARPPLLGLDLKEPSPPARPSLAPRSNFALAHAPEAPATVAPRSPDSAVRLRANHRHRAASAPIFRRGEHLRTLPSPPMLFVSRFLASRALAASSASRGRRPWRPPR